jgi:hypothetical protein
MTNQNDFVIDNGTGLAVREDIQDALQALAGLSSGNSEPSVKYAYQLWADTNSGILKIRNGSNNDWIELLQLDGTLTMEDGSASTPGLAFRDDLNTGIFSSAADTFNVATAGSERFRANSSGLGIGDTSISFPSGTGLAIFDSSTPRIKLTNSTTGTGSTDGGFIYVSSSDLYIENKETAAIRFYTSATEKARLDSGGRLLIGHTSGTPTGFSPKLAIEHTDSAASLSVIRDSNNSFGPFIALGKSRGSSVGGTTIIHDDDVLGTINFYGADGDDLQNSAAKIFCRVDGTPGSDDMPGSLVFSTTADGAGSATERLEITSSGKLLINKTTDRNAYYGGTLTGNLQVEGTGNLTRLTQFIHNTDTAGGHIVVIGKSRGASVGSYTVVQDDDYLGTLSFQGADGDAMIEGARIDAIVDGTPGDQDMPTRLSFGTTADGASSTSERMVIDSSGIVKIERGSSSDTALEINTTATSGATRFKFNESGSNKGQIAYSHANDQIEVIGNTGNGIAFLTNGVSSTAMTIDTSQRVGIGTTSMAERLLVVTTANTMVPLAINDSSSTATTTHRISVRTGNTEVGSIKSTNSATTFNTSSDYRLKENAVAISDGITRLKTLKPYRFNFKNNANKSLDGFFAHEVTAVPEAVDGVKDEVATQDHVDMGLAKEIGDPIYQSIDHSKLVPLLTSSLQEAIAKIETLETKVAALEAA